MFDTVRVATRGRPETLIVGRFKDEEMDKATRSRDVEGSIARAFKRAECTGAAGEVTPVFPSKGFSRVLIVGLGKRKGFDGGSLRAAAGAVGRALAGTGGGGVEIDLAGLMSKARVDAARAGQCFGEGMGLIAWTYDTLKGTTSKAKDREKLTLQSGDGAFSKGMKRGLALAEGSNLARTLSQTPPNIATPAWMASQARKLAKKTGLKCTVYKGAQLEQHKLTGLINVGKASENGACLIRLEYTPPRGSKGQKPTVLVGKTVTYDTGGLSLKVNNGMKGMKRDKDGGCGVLGAMHNIATVVKPGFPVVGILVAAENSISNNAYRPDDVIAYPNGVTVEVTNTDAEGRLVLADGLIWACRKEKAARVLEFSTLTGGIVVALGSHHAGLYCDDKKLRESVQRAAEASGEPVWHMPLVKGHRDMMKSPVADILNSAPIRECHGTQGPAFLSYFVDEGVPFAHVDIAGMHAFTEDRGPYIAGPTGFGARLAAEILGA